ncbi:uncharacterized protein PAC_10151 [Phialocephala subalpina]|uniref:Uncharacterized protein n=1 Tax=Phialocephala subalpina TaxID=576137 RepID=A0A1L7X5H2_9HELO|nr:uncharacterized protein PAC_10151 [Phialocephala subalpina]
MMFGRRHRTNTDIYPATERYPPPQEHSCSTPRSSRLHFLNLPAEVRRCIFYQYFLSLNLPAEFFHHLTFLGYWAGPSEPNASPNDKRGYDLGRKIRPEVERLLLVCQQTYDEAREVLYGSFVFYVHPRYQTQFGRKCLYAKVEDSWKIKGHRLPHQVQNIQINIVLDHLTRTPACLLEWRKAWIWLGIRLPRLRKIGLAIDYIPPSDDEESTNDMTEILEIVLEFVRIFEPTCRVDVRFAGVKYDSYACLAPASPPLYGDMLDEEKLLLRLRDDEKLIWHNVAKRFNDPRSELYSVAGLQARYRRLKLRHVQSEMETEFLQKLKEELRHQRDNSLESGTSTSETPTIMEQ